MDGDNSSVQWALDLLTRDPNYRENLLSKYWSEIFCGFSGFAIPCLHNWANKRPLYTGIQKHGLGIIAGIGIGYLLHKREIRILAERDAIFRDYIIRHPEDFPPPDMKKYKDVFLEWVPIR